MAVRNHLLNTLVLLGFSSALALPGTVLANDAADGGEIDDIIVTATRLPRNIMEIAGTVSVVTGEDIERQVASDLDDLIRYQPGVTMNTNGRGGNMGFIIRGMGGNRVLTLIDGIRAGDSYARGPVAQGVDRFEVDDLKAVEIIRGPASVLYGSDAMGGAVILRTKDPIDYLDGDSSYVGVRAGYAGANELAKLGLTGATRVGDLGLFLQYTNRAYEERDIAGEGSLNPQDGESHGLLLKTVWAPGDGHRLKLSFETMREDNDFELLTELSSSVFESLAEDQMERSRVSLQYDWSIGAGFADSVETHVFSQTADGLQHTTQDRMVYSFFDVTNFATYFGEPGLRVSDFEFNQEMSGIGAMFTKTFTAGSTEHALVYGLTYDVIDTERPRERYEVQHSTGDVTQDIRLIPGGALVFQGIDPGPYFEVFPNRSFPDTETRRTGVYVQDEIAFGTSGFTLIPGLRYERYEMDPSSEGILDISGFGFGITSVSESHTSANLGLIYDVNEEVALFAQYAE
ncbi:MAG: TonB-dependent receptor, partial [Proteobacteria bacterium]|nr:TonB-dependent receptor [Pseudomonadota bacterium]